MFKSKIISKMNKYLYFLVHDLTFCTVYVLCLIKLSFIKSEPIFSINIIIFIKYLVTLITEEVT